MASSTSKYHYSWELSKRDPTVNEAATELLLEIGNPEEPVGATRSLLVGLDNSIVNGLRRIILGEVETWGFRQDIKVPETFISRDGQLQMGNLTVFNAQHLSDRIGMVPVHGDPSDRVFEDPENWIFRICDPEDPDKPLRHDHLAEKEDLYNRQLYVKVKDIRIFHRKTSPSAIEAPGTIEGEGASSTSITATGTGGTEGTEAEGSDTKTTVAVSREVLSKATTTIDFIDLESGEWEEMPQTFHSQIFKFPELILAALKRGESLFSEMHPVIGSGGVVNPNSMVPNDLTHARWISAIPEYRFKMEKEYQPDYDRQEQIENAIKNLEIEKELQPILSRKKINEVETKKVEEYWNNLDGLNLFIAEGGVEANAAEAAWATLSNAEKRQWEEKASGFFTGNPRGLEQEKTKIKQQLDKLEAEYQRIRKEEAALRARMAPPEKTNDPILDQQNYRRSTDPILGRYDMPERWIFKIIYNGHMWPGQIWIRAIETMISKIEKFQREVLEKIQDFGGRIAEHVTVEFSRDVAHKMEIILDDFKEVESATLGQLIKCHFIYLLDHLIAENYPGSDQYFEVMRHCFAAWKVPHPLIPTLHLTFKTPGPDYPLFGTKGLFFDLYNEEKNETLRLLKVTCHQLLIRLRDLLEEAQTMHRQRGIVGTRTK